MAEDIEERIAKAAHEKALVCIVSRKSSRSLRNGKQYRANRRLLSMKVPTATVMEVLNGHGQTFVFFAV